jgi:hypothetical protein
MGDNDCRGMATIDFICGNCLIGNPSEIGSFGGVCKNGAKTAMYGKNPRKRAVDVVTATAVDQAKQPPVGPPKNPEEKKKNLIAIIKKNHAKITALRERRKKGGSSKGKGGSPKGGSPKGGLPKGGSPKGGSPKGGLPKGGSPKGRANPRAPKYAKL